ncbi:matrix metalloproteinase-14-like protein, partial [Dinothrombium tinctorium]
TTINNVTYLFRGEHYFTINSNGKVKRKGRRISDDFIGVPNNLDAAVTTRYGYTYFFKGNQYYEVRRKRLILGPKPISYRFKNIPNNLDAAFVHWKNGLIYFVKDGKFFRYESEGKQLSDIEIHENFHFMHVDLTAAFTSKRNSVFLLPYIVTIQNERKQDTVGVKKFFKCNN